VFQPYLERVVCVLVKMLLFSSKGTWASRIEEASRLEGTSGDQVAQPLHEAGPTAELDLT